MSKSATQTKQQPATKGATKTNTPAPTSSAGLLAAANSNPVTTSAAQPIKKPAVVYVAGVAANAPANAPVVTLAGQAFNGALPASNPSNRGAVGTVKNPNAVLVAGNGKAPKSAHGAAMFAAVVAALPATAQTLANAAGHGGGAFIGYCLKNGWLAPSK